MPAFVYRLIAPRDTVSVDMTEEERATLAEHGRYWSRLMEEGKALAFGPVHDPAGSHGLRAEISPMPRLVTPAGVYD